MADDRLEARLREVGGRLDVPETPHMAPAVGRRVREPGPGRRRPRAVRLAAAALAVLVIGGTATALLLIPGVEVERVPVTPSAPAPGEPELLGLGRRVGLQEARDAVDINVLIPRQLGRPDAVYVGPRPAGGRVTMVYEPRPDLPADPNTGTGMLVTMFRGSTDTSFVRKQVGSETSVRPITVEQAPGMWIEGAPHTVTYIDERGTEFADDIRLAGNVLIWQVGGITLRLESRLDLDPSLEVAASMG